MTSAKGPTQPLLPVASDAPGADEVKEIGKGSLVKGTKIQRTQATIEPIENFGLRATRSLLSSPS